MFWWSVSGLICPTTSQIGFYRAICFQNSGIWKNIGTFFWKWFVFKNSVCENNPFYIDIMKSLNANGRDVYGCYLFACRAFIDLHLDHDLFVYYCMVWNREFQSGREQPATGEKNTVFCNFKRRFNGVGEPVCHHYYHTAAVLFWPDSETFSAGFPSADSVCSWLGLRKPCIFLYLPVFKVLWIQKFIFHDISADFCWCP